MQIILSLLIFWGVSQASIEPIQGTWRPQGLGLCQCVGGMKDYDPTKGYYYDRVERSGLRKKISGRFACSYTCRDTNGEYWKVSYVHEEWHWGGKARGPEDAQKFICDKSISQFIPKRDLMGNISYYETVPYGAFDARVGGRAEFHQFAQGLCSQ